MTDRELMQQVLKLALEALERALSDDRPYIVQCKEAITTIREALAEQPKESPKFDPNESFAREEAAQARVREFMRNH